MTGRRFKFNNDRDDLLAREIIQEFTGSKDPEISLAEDFMEEIDLRLEQVKIFHPMMEILKRRKADNEILRYVPELCFLILSFLIYEGKLKHRGLTFQNIQTFLGKALKRIYARDFENLTVRELTFELVDALQNSGRNFILSTYSFKTGSFREKFVKFIEIKQSEEGALEYFITEQGVEFYLKTKEFPDETKITINLLLFQKQMEKGAFGFAYETVRRLNMEVQKKKDRKFTILESLMYGRLDQGEAYNNYHRSIIMQFEEEAELFDVAIKNVNNAFGEYVEKMNSGNLSAKEEQAFTLIKIIEKEIGRAQTLHTELLKEAAKFTEEYDRTLAIRRKSIFAERFNFQGEFEKLITRKENPGAIKYLFEPLMTLKIPKGFNLLRMFIPQRIAKSSEEDKEIIENTVDKDRDTLDKRVSRRVRENFVFYAANLLNTLKPDKKICLTDYCDFLKEKYTDEIIYNGDFISFLIELNREKELGEYTRIIRFRDKGITASEDEGLKSIEEIFLKSYQTLNTDCKIRQITVTSIPDEELELLPGLKITNMMFAGED
ncbi:MAG: hypothetical protein GX236_09795 [Clostridiaceae bacterium]|nr:hypothetical protein [Clostridiaceae bacterium]